MSLWQDGFKNFFKGSENGIPEPVFTHDDKYVPGLKRLTDAVKDKGAKIAAQLYHAGRYTLSSGREELVTAATDLANNLDALNVEVMLNREADTIVIAVGSTPDKALANKVESLVPEVHLVGDAKDPRNALDALREGFLAGLEI